MHWEDEAPEERGPPRRGGPGCHLLRRCFGNAPRGIRTPSLVIRSRIKGNRVRPGMSRRNLAVPVGKDGVFVFFVSLTEEPWSFQRLQVFRSPPNAR
jgi:hypothetical protein